jgi:hypothetical protein
LIFSGTSETAAALKSFYRNGDGGKLSLAMPMRTTGIEVGFKPAPFEKHKGCGTPE